MADVKISDLPAAGSITGSEDVPVVQSGTTVKTTVNAMKNGSVKTYRALISQSGTDAPVATVLENTLGATPVYSRTNFGNYKITSTGLFPVGKTASLIALDYWGADAPQAVIGQVSADQLAILTSNLSDVAVDLGPGVTFVQVLVYP